MPVEVADGWAVPSVSISGVLLRIVSPLTRILHQLQTTLKSAHSVVLGAAA
jgi:hypothetical protein